MPAVLGAAIEASGPAVARPWRSSTQSAIDALPDIPAITEDQPGIRRPSCLGVRSSASSSSRARPTTRSAKLTEAFMAVAENPDFQSLMDEPRLLHDEHLWG